MNFVLFFLFMTLFLGCNSEYADIDRISKLPTLLVQLGSKSGGGDNCLEMAIDKYENIICVGTTSSLALPSDGTIDAFVAKFNRQGKLLWVKQLRSAGGGDERCSSVGVDKQGNIYCGGSTNGILGTGAVKNKEFNSGTSTFEWNDRLPAASDYDAMVAKLTPDGEVIWIKQFGTKNEDRCGRLAVAPSGAIYCASFTNGELGTDASTGQDEYLTATSYNPMVAKLDLNGNILWIRQFGFLSRGAANTAEDTCNSLDMDKDENIYCGGSTSGSIADTNVSAQADLMVWILDKNGFTLNTLQLGLSASAHPDVLSTSGIENCLGIVVDKNKNIYCSSIVSTSYAETNGGGKDGLVAKWNADYTLAWVTQMGAFTTVPGFDNTLDQDFRSLTLTPDGSVVAAGITKGSTAGPHQGNSDVFLVKFSQDGKIVWGRQYGSPDDEITNRLVSDELGNLYCPGNTNGSFGKTKDGSLDMFFMRLNSEGKF